MLAGVRGNHTWATMSEFELQKKTKKTKNTEGVVCLHDVDSQIAVSVCVQQRTSLCKLYNWLMGLQNPQRKARSLDNITLKVVAIG